MSVVIMTDSASDITQAEAKEWGIRVIPLSVRFGADEYADGVDIDTHTFYERLIESDVLPNTSQASPATFKAAFDEATANGDSVICVVVSSKLSGTYQSAVLGAEECSGEVHVVDSLNVTIGQRLLVLSALQHARDGYSAEQIASRLEMEREQVVVLAMLDTLEYLKKGGRISSAAAFAGTLLGIKPVVTVDDGLVAVVGKARGSKNGNNLLRKLIDHVGGINFDRPLCLAYSGLNDLLLQKYIADSADLWQDHINDLPTAVIGSVIGTHVGPGAVGIAFFKK